MPVSAALQSAYRFQRNTRLGSGFVPIGQAVAAIARARRDVANGTVRYPRDNYAAVCWQSGKPGIAYVQSIMGAGLRHVGDVVANCGGRNGYWHTRNGRAGWYTDPHGDSYKDGTGLCWGVVYQLPGRDGMARFVAGYVMGGCSDENPTIDFSYIHESPTDYSAQDCDAAIDAARAADSMAERAAEAEREYQTAWSAGSLFAVLGDDIATQRKAALALFKERRLAKAVGLSGDTYGAICEALRAAIASAVSTIEKAREKRAQLASGDYDRPGMPLYFSTRDAALREAFNEGAGETVLPV